MLQIQPFEESFCQILLPKVAFSAKCQSNLAVLIYGSCSQKNNKCALAETLHKLCHKLNTKVVQMCLFYTSFVSFLLLFLSKSAKLTKKVKFSHTHYRALGPELIPVNRQSVNHDIDPAAGTILERGVRP